MGGPGAGGRESERWSGPRSGRGSSLPDIDRTLWCGPVFGIVLPTVVGSALDVGVIDIGGTAVFPFGGVVGLEAASGAVTAIGVTAPPVTGP